MEKIVELVKAMNDMGDLKIETPGVRIFQTDEKNSIIKTWFIKKRTVTGEDGIQTWEYVAREEK